MPEAVPIPTVSWSQQTWSVNLGQIRPGSREVFSVDIINDSDRSVDLEVESVSCGCTQTKLPESPVDPDGKIRLGVELQAGLNHGMKKYYINLSSSAEEKGGLVLEAEITDFLHSGGGARSLRFEREGGVPVPVSFVEKKGDLALPWKDLRAYSQTAGFVAEVSPVDGDAWEVTVVPVDEEVKWSGSQRIDLNYSFTDASGEEVGSMTRSLAGWLDSDPGVVTPQVLLRKGSQDGPTVVPIRFTGFNEYRVIAADLVGAECEGLEILDDGTGEGLARVALRNYVRPTAVSRRPMLILSFELRESQENKRVQTVAVSVY